MSNLRSRVKFGESAWSWDFLNGNCFGAHDVRIGDIDGFGEQHDHLLLIEAKPTGYRWRPGNAQRRAHKVFARRPGQVCLVLYGDSPEAPTVTEAQANCLGTFDDLIPTSNDSVIEWVRRWFEHARSGCDASACTWAVPVASVAGLEATA